MASIGKNKVKRPPPPERTGEMLESEYGHSSGDRNTRTDEHEWKHFKDGKEHTRHSSDPPRRS